MKVFVLRGAFLLGLCGGALAAQGGLELDMLPGLGGEGASCPSLTRGADGHVYLSFVEQEAGVSSLQFTRWEGEAWSPLRSVARGEDWFVNWADFPALAVLEDGTLAAHWLARLGQGTYAYGVRVSVSRDAGNHWSEPQWLHEDRSPSEHGFVSLVPLDAERFGALWLDGRSTATGGSMQLRWRTLGADGELGPEELVDGRVCDCCQTALVLDAERRPLAVWRDREGEPELRDLALARRTGEGWSAPEPVHVDGWELDGCPVNGPRLAGGERPACVWYTGASGRSRLRFALWGEAGHGFEAPIELAGGETLGRVDLVALPQGQGWLTSWLEAVDGPEAAWMLRRVDPRGVGLIPREVARVHVARSSGFLRMARDGDAVLLAWTSSGAEGGISCARARW